MKKLIGKSMMIFLMVTAPAVAGIKCIGEDKISSFSLSSDPSEEGTLIVRQTLNGQPRELKDDTGLLGARVLSSAIAASNSSSKKDSIRLVQLRLKKFKRVMADNGVKEGDAIMKKIAHLNELFNQNPLETMKISGAWEQLENSLHAGGINVTAASRPVGSKTWGAEKPLKEFDLPVLLRSRSMGCEAQVEGDVQLGDAINASISKVAEEPRSSYSSEEVIKFFQNQTKGKGTK